MPTVLFFIDILAMHADLDMHSVLSLHAVLALHAVIRISNDCVNQIMIYFRLIILYSPVQSAVSIILHSSTFTGFIFLSFTKTF